MRGYTTKEITKITARAVAALVVTGSSVQISPALGPFLLTLGMGKFRDSLKAAHHPAEALIWPCR
jgi:hypothetical protein